MRNVLPLLADVANGIFATIGAAALTHTEIVWWHHELATYIKKYGVDEWITPYYLRFNWISGIEYLLFLIAVLSAASVLLY